MELDALYEAVPAAQEEDLLDEVAEERRWAAVVDWLRRYEEPGSTPVAAEDEPEPDDEPRLTPGQVLGLVQHRLGGVVLPSEDPPST